MTILCAYIPDKKTLGLLNNVIDSFETRTGVGLPLGNLTSQLFVNIYMNEFDQYMKHCIKAKYYIRYADDFVILSQDMHWLETVLVGAWHFLDEKLRLELHPDKVFIKTLASGIDFLGWVHFPTHRVLRTRTRRRFEKNMNVYPSREALVSYLGLLQYGDTYHLCHPLLHKLAEIDLMENKRIRGIGMIKNKKDP